MGLFKGLKNNNNNIKDMGLFKGLKGNNKNLRDIYV